MVSAAITHIRVTFPEAQDPVIFIQHPPASVAKPKYLTEAQLADLEATVRDNLPLLVESENRDVAEFGHRVYLQIAGYVLNEQGMECNLYLKWRQALREQRTCVNKFPALLTPFNSGKLRPNANYRI